MDTPQETPQNQTPQNDKSSASKRSWFRRHPIITVILGIFLFFIIIAIFAPNYEQNCRNGDLEACSIVCKRGDGYERYCDEIPNKLACEKGNLEACSTACKGGDVTICEKACSNGDSEACKIGCHNGDQTSCEKACIKGNLEACSKACHNGDQTSCEKACHNGDQTICKQIADELACKEGNLEACSRSCLGIYGRDNKRACKILDDSLNAEADKVGNICKTKGKDSLECIRGQAEVLKLDCDLRKADASCSLATLSYTKLGLYDEAYRYCDKACALDNCVCADIDCLRNKNKFGGCELSKKYNQEKK